MSRICVHTDSWIQGIDQLNLPFLPFNSVFSGRELEVLSKLEIWKRFSLSLRSEAPMFHGPFSQYLKTFHR